MLLFWLHLFWDNASSFLIYRLSIFWHVGKDERYFKRDQDKFVEINQVMKSDPFHLRNLEKMQKMFWPRVLLIWDVIFGTQQVRLKFARVVRYLFCFLNIFKGYRGKICINFLDLALCEIDFYYRKLIDVQHATSLNTVLQIYKFYRVNFPTICSTFFCVKWSQQSIEFYSGKSRVQGTRSYLSRLYVL